MQIDGSEHRWFEELRLAGIADREAGSAYLPRFMERFDARVARVAVRVDDRHRPLGLSRGHLGDVLVWREQRHVGRDLALSYERQRVILEDSDLTRGLAGLYVDT